MATEAWLGLSLATVLVWGGGTLVSKPATARLGARRMLALVAVGETLVYTVLFLTLRTDMTAWEAFPVVAAVVGGIVGVLGYVFYYQGIGEGSVGLMGTITAAYPAPTILLSILLLGESLDAEQTAGVVLVLACVVALAWEPRESRTSSRLAVVMALLAFVCWGLWGYFAKVAVDSMGDGNLFGFYASTTGPVIGIFLLVSWGRGKSVPRDRRPSTAALALCDVGFGASGVVLLTVAFALGPASLVSAVTGSYPVVSTLAAHFLLKERFGWREALSLALFVPGIILIAL